MKPTNPSSWRRLCKGGRLFQRSAYNEVHSWGFLDGTVVSPASHAHGLRSLPGQDHFCSLPARLVAYLGQSPSFIHVQSATMAPIA